MSQEHSSSFIQGSIVLGPRSDTVFLSGKIEDLGKELMTAFRREPAARLSDLKTFEVSPEGI